MLMASSIVFFYSTIIFSLFSFSLSLTFFQTAELFFLLISWNYSFKHWKDIHLTSNVLIVLCPLNVSSLFNAVFVHGPEIFYNNNTRFEQDCPAFFIMQTEISQVTDLMSLSS
jgi:hypothetical protein